MYPMQCLHIIKYHKQKMMSVSQYLMHVKDYLEHINHISRLSSMASSRLNHISLVQGLSDTYVRRRASKEAEN